MNVNEAIQLALNNLQEGNLQQAEYMFKEILRIQPDNIDALHFLGITCYQLNNYDAAIEYIKKALLSDSNDPIVFYAYYILGNAFQKRGQFDEAISYYQKALELNPNFAEVYYDLGNVFREKQQINEAIKCYQKALQVNPNLTNAFNELADVLKEQGKLDEVIIDYSRELEIKPDYAAAHYHLGKILSLHGRKEEALSAYDRALKCNPNYYFKVRWAKCFAHLPIIYPEQSLIEISRKLYKDDLIKLRDAISSATSQEIESLAEEVGALQPFFLAYRCLNDRELQQIYGDVVCRVMALHYPQFAHRISMPSRMSGEPLRIGIVSAYFCLHSNWKIPIKGWVENLDKQRFSLYGYYTGKKKDNQTVVARQIFKRFIEDVYIFEDLCKIIRGDNLHILIYPEIGMDPVTGRLATLRLAPVQCASWGHPDTSGLPTIDYFLSSDLMESPDASGSYTERLVQLPNLSIYYSPLDISPIPATRDNFGLRPDAILYLCCQSLFKYLPQYDEIYPQIAQEINNCQFVFLSYPTNWVTEQFRYRLNQAFKKFDLNAKDYVFFLPRLNPEQYYAINRLSDIYLDSIGWSGCNSTFEAIACNLPIVTLPGTLMRGRHSSAILIMMGMKETIASTLDEYIESALRLGKDLEWRRQISEKIAENKHRVYRDRSCIKALENFLERVVKERI